MKQEFCKGKYLLEEYINIKNNILKCTLSPTLHCYAALGVSLEKSIQSLGVYGLIQQSQGTA